MQGVRDSSALYEVERRAYHAVCPAFRIAELQNQSYTKGPLALSQ